MLDQLVQLDKDLFLFLNGLGNTSWDGFWMFYTTKKNWVPFYAILLFLMYKKRDNKAFLITVVVVALMILFTDQVTNLFKKVLFRRPRPCYDETLLQTMRLVRDWCGGKFGYFSGHASNSMAVAVFVGLFLRYKYKYFIFILLFWAALMAYSRVYIGVHYPLDIVSGMLFGALSGFGFYKLHNYLENRFVTTK